MRMSYNQIPRQQVRGIGQKLLYDSISILKFKLQTNNRQHTPLVAYILFVFVLIPKISGNILPIIGVPDTEISNQVRFTETETPVCPDIHGMIIRILCGIDLVFIQNSTIQLL